jgi:hypothetical protein
VTSIAAEAQDVSGGKSGFNFPLVIGIIVGVAALAVVVASLRMTEHAIDKAVAQREAAGRFLASELSVLRMMAMTSQSPVPARLYLGIEECFQKSVAVPADATRWQRAQRWSWDGSTRRAAPRWPRRARAC